MKIKIIKRTIAGLCIVLFMAFANVINSQTDDKVVKTNGSDALPIIIAIDQNEISAAELAQNKQIRSSVSDYANMLLKAHTDNLNQANDLAGLLSLSLTPDNIDVMEIKEKGSDMMVKLGALDGTEFEREYIDAMIKGHTDALAKIDMLLASDPVNDQVKSFLTETRTSVQGHLEEAKNLQQK